MATTGQMVDILPTGMNVDMPGGGPIIVNYFRRDGAWIVRPGLGQESQFDSTLLRSDLTNMVHLGSKEIVTDFGHEQILMVFAVNVHTGNLFNASADDYRRGRFTRAVLVHVRDVTAGTTWEELLVPNSSRSAGEAQYMHGVWETDKDWDFEAYITAGNDKPCWFVQFNDTVVFGSPGLGLWCYVPAVFGRTAVRQWESTLYHSGHIRCESDSTVLIDLRPTDGEYSDGYAYLNDAEFPRSVAACSIQGRMVYAADNVVWFSDPGRPACVLADNFYAIPTDDHITALGDSGGNLTICTRTSTWFFDGTWGELVVGSAVQVSQQTGCLSQHAMGRIDNGLAWVDDTGIWGTVTGLQIEPLSKDIGEFWRKGIEDPRTQYYQTGGLTDLANVQPTLRWAHDTTDDKVQLAYVLPDRMLVATWPRQRISLVLSGGAWALWTCETLAAAQGTVAATQGIENPWFVALPSGLWCVASPNSVTLDDETLLDGGLLASPAEEDRTVGSWALLRMGRGGALDRTAVVAEDRRRFAGKFYDIGHSVSEPKSAIRIERWIPVQEGTQLPSGVLAPAKCHLWPVRLVFHPNPGLFTWADIDSVTFIFTFDYNRWAPVLRADNPAEVAAVLPSERIASAAGFGIGAPVAGTAEVQLYRAGVLAPVNGNQIRIRWDGASSTGFMSPHMNMATKRPEPWIYLPMYARNNSADVVSAGIEVDTATIEGEHSGIPYSLVPSVYAWQQAEAPLARVARSGQCVDHAIETEALRLANSQIRLRSVFIDAVSHGCGTGVIAPRYGLLNLVMASDYKGMSGQVVDHASGAIRENNDHDGIRTRFRDSTGALKKRTFKNGPKWGDSTDTAAGDYLIDSEEFDSVAISDSVQGEEVRLLLHGHLKNDAEVLRVSRLRAVIRKAGMPRRTGR